MQDWKERYNPILLVCIAVAFCAALWLMQIRVGIESCNDTVEQTLDHQAVLMMAQREGRDSDKLLRQFKEAGVTTLIVYDTTLERLDREGRISACCRRLPQGLIGEPLIRSSLLRISTRMQCI